MRCGNTKFLAGGNGLPLGLPSRILREPKKVLGVAAPITKSASVRLVVVHSHFRPGGVRRVIELALPAFAASSTLKLTEVVLLGGERPDQPWNAAVRTRLPGIRVRFAATRALGYIAETRATPAGVARAVKRVLDRTLDAGPAGDTVVWAHNLGLGRNLLLANALTRACQRRGIPLVSHHHDWWFDNRWQRWPEFQRTGFHTLASIAKTVFATASTVRHAAINRADQRALSGSGNRSTGLHSTWFPNLVVRPPLPSRDEVAQARHWCHGQMEGRAPFWLLPCRLLRRKNVAEAWLLARWFRPDAWLLTTGGTSSADERPYAEALRRAGQHHGWKLRLGILAGGESDKPRIPALLAASEVLLLTSVQEGFGLPNLEAAAAQRPLLARRLPLVAPDLKVFGFHFAQAYDEVWIDPRLFDQRAEQDRQEARWLAWRRALPRACRVFATRPPWLESPGRAWAFSRLTLQAQLEVLSHPPAETWNACVRLNPSLQAWPALGAAAAWSVSAWPEQADRFLSADAYARRFARLLRPSSQAAVSASAAASTARQVSESFFRDRLGGHNQYPLLWSLDP